MPLGHNRRSCQKCIPTVWIIHLQKCIPTVWIIHLQNTRLLFQLCHQVGSRYTAHCTGGVSYSVGGAATPPTSTSVTPTLWPATPIFEVPVPRTDQTSRSQLSSQMSCNVLPSHFDTWHWDTVGIHHTRHLHNAHSQFVISVTVGSVQNHGGLLSSRGHVSQASHSTETPMELLSAIYVRHTSVDLNAKPHPFARHLI